MLTLIYYFTFINFLLITIFGSKISRFFTWCFTVFSSFFSLAFIFFYFFNLVFYEYTVFYVNFGLWFKLDCLTVSFGFLFDALSTIMCFTIIFISLLVQIYSYCYMFFDQNLPRFLSYLSLFTFFMLILVTADNFAVLFIGWEGVGLCSFLLISFWSCRVTALKSALKAILVNRIGDFFLLFGICFIYNEFNSLNFLTIFNLVPYYINCSVFFLFFKIDLLNCVSFLLLLGAVGKSAQIGLHVWLPDAMEGPTPVSALIHAATMVTAGVFVIIRCSFFFEYAPKILFLLIFFGSLTSIFAGLCATIENDIKKIIAYSTCSQLGYMFFSCGFSSYSVSLFHLFNHAFFKALLFLCAGVIIHALSNEQNIIHMGSLKKLLPFTYCATLIGLMSLTGFPFLSGFYSKELILLVIFLFFLA